MVEVLFPELLLLCALQGDVELANGQRVEKLLVVNKVRLKEAIMCLLCSMKSIE